MSKWREVRLGDLIGIKHGYAFKGKDIIDTDNGVVLVTPGNFDFSGGFKDTGKKFFKGEIPEEFILKPNDLIVTMTDLSKNADTLGYSALIPSDENIYLHNQRIGLIDIKSDLIYENYLYWVLRTPWYQRRIANTSTGVNVKHTSPRKIYEYKLNLPDLETQEKIADILSTYDELIENNNRRIEILEKTAEEIYKEWFVRMRFPGHENTKFIKGIPEGWEVRKAEDVISFDIGGGWGKETIESDFLEKAYVIRGTDIPDMKYGKFNYELLRFHKESNLKNRKLKDGDIIFEASGGSSSQRLGRTIYINHEILSMYDENVIPASFCKLIRINNKESSWLFNCYLNYAYEKEILSTFEVQSTGISNFGFTSFKKHHTILMPNRDLIEKFYNTTYKNYQSIVTLCRMNQNLIKQRDLLLPRLMNGTIEVK